MTREKLFVENFLNQNGRKYLEHGVFEWVEEKVVRDGLGRFAKKVTDVTTSVTEGIGDVVDGVAGAIDAIFKLAGGLPDWVYSQLFYAFNNGLLTEAEIMDAFNSLGKNPSMQQKINAVDQLISKREKEIDVDGFTSLDELPTKEIKPLEEVLAEDHFEYVDWEEEDKRVGNCPLSTFAYELQRRGYDVEAMDLENGTDMLIESLHINDDRLISPNGTLYASKEDMDYLDAMFEESFTTYDMYSSKPSDAQYFTDTRAMSQYMERNSQEYPPKSRGFLEMDGHIQNWEVNSQGEVIWIDGQLGGYYGEGKLGRTTTTPQANASSMVAILRTDNKEINEIYLQAMREQDDTVRALQYMKNQLEREKYEVRDQVRDDVSDYYKDLVEDELEKLR